jgi:hypothetical protein
MYVARAHKRQPVILFIAGAHIRVCTDDGVPIRELVLDPNRIYQRMTAPRRSLINWDSGPLRPET